LISLPVIRAGDALMIAKLERWFVLVLLALSVCSWASSDAATDGLMKKWRSSLSGSSTAADREWLGDGILYVLALRLQHLPQLKVTVLSRSMPPTSKE
jgi:hypothetical protein